MASAAEQLAANMNLEAFQKASELHKRLWFTLIALVVWYMRSVKRVPVGEAERPQRPAQGAQPPTGAGGAQGPQPPAGAGGAQGGPPGGHP